jgi:hypothetical protein
MVVREEATDAQIADALRQGLPHLTDPAFPQDRHSAQEFEGTDTSEKDMQSLHRRRGRAPRVRVKLRRRIQRCSPQTDLLPLWETFLPTTGAGLGRLTGRTC